MKRFLLFTSICLTIFQSGCDLVTNFKTTTTTTNVRTPSTSPPTEMSLPAIAIPEPTPIAKDAIELIEKIGGKYELSTTGDLKSLSISGDKIAVEMFDTFAKQIELTTLKITNFPNFNDDTLQKLTGLKKITNLTITHSAITDVSVETIVKSFPLISVLDLSRNFSLTDKSIAEISKLSELETLILVYCSFSDSQLSTLATLPKLRALDIRGNMSISNKGLESVAGIPKLRSLKHLSPAIDDGGVKALAAAKNLETLDVQDFTISDLAGEVLKNFPKLSSLIIYRCTNFGSNGLLSLQGKPLKRLTLRDLPAIDDDGLIAFRELSTLKRLYLQELDSVSDGGLRNLIYLKELETLEIRNMTLITDKTVESISRLSNLKSISISGTQITDKSIELLLSLQKLKELTLKNNSLITDDAKKKLKDSKKFAILNLE